MKYRFEKNSGVLTVQISGELDHHNSAPLRTAIDNEFISSGARSMIIDLSQLELMDSSGIGLVMGRYKLLSEFNGTLEVTGLSNNAYKVMRLAGLDRIATIKKGGK